MAISEKVKGAMVVGNYIRKMFEEGIALKKIHGNENVFDLSIGNPVLEPPEAFKQELKRLIDNPPPGLHFATEPAGYVETRQAIASQLSLDTGVKYKKEHIVIAYGAAGAVNIGLKAILNPGDEVISFVPNYFEYVNYTENHGGIIKYVAADEDLNPVFSELESAFSPKTKAVIINSPNNPTGHAYSHTVLKKIAEMVTRAAARLKTTIYIVSDDVYTNIYFGEGKCPRILNYYPNTIMGTSYSKDLSLPGERIGYVAVHPECVDRDNIISGLNYANRVLGFVNAPSIMQKAVCNLQNVRIDTNIYRRKRDFLYKALTDMGYSIVKPEGAFYIFPKSPIPDDEAFVLGLKDLLVLTTPGFVFKAPGYFRLSYCMDDATIAGALPGLKKGLEKYRS
ncbi:MAG TPA: pyridoxal phosphate-dependent aminotransferase [Dehalococcoidales bacterium]|nr:pyridoxal phosphate-dependent aminotransferase [Dehalococcoidales bacterium]